MRPIMLSNATLLHELATNRQAITAVDVEIYLPTITWPRDELARAHRYGALIRTAAGVYTATPGWSEHPGRSLVRQLIAKDLRCGCMRWPPGTFTPKVCKQFSLRRFSDRIIATMDTFRAVNVNLDLEGAITQARNTDRALGVA